MEKKRNPWTASNEYISMVDKTTPSSPLSANHQQREKQVACGPLDLKAHSVMDKKAEQ